jgi:hypothetical protein
MEVYVHVTYLPFFVLQTNAFTFKFDETPCEKWGINFAGRVEVVFTNGDETKEFFLPGVGTYDPSGKSGDPHASERIGDSCAKVLLQLAMCQLAVLQCGQSVATLRDINLKFDPIIDQYHGRKVMQQWICASLEQVVSGKECPEFPAFLKKNVLEHKIYNDACYAHTAEYLKTGQPPRQYYAKVAAKEPGIEKTMSEDEAWAFANLLLSYEPSDITKLICENSWFSESEVMWPGQKMSLKVEKVLYHRKSPLQVPPPPPPPFFWYSPYTTTLQSKTAHVFKTFKRLSWRSTLIDKGHDVSPSLFSSVQSFYVIFRRPSLPPWLMHAPPLFSRPSRRTSSCSSLPRMGRCWFSTA